MLTSSDACGALYNDADVFVDNDTTAVAAMLRQLGCYLICVTGLDTTSDKTYSSDVA